MMMSIKMMMLIVMMQMIMMMWIMTMMLIMMMMMLIMVNMKATLLKMSNMLSTDLHIGSMFESSDRELEKQHLFSFQIFVIFPHQNTNLPCVYTCAL